MAHTLDSSPPATATAQHQRPVSPHSGINTIMKQEHLTTTTGGRHATSAANNAQARRSNNGLAIRTFSPVDKNGCFEFDRVLKAGNVQKRTRKTKSWKPVHLVLRPQNLSLYADTEGTKLRHQIPLADLTAVARQRDPKKKERHVFALFSPERKYHIEAPSEAEAQTWVELIRSQARIGEDEDEVVAMMSPTLDRTVGGEADSGFFGRSAGGAETSASEMENHQPLRIKKSRSRNRVLDSTPRTTNTGNIANTRSSSAPRRSSLGMQYLSGGEAASYSDFSDTGFVGGSSAAYRESTLSLPQQSQAEKEERARKLDEIYRPSTQHTAGMTTTESRPVPRRSVSGLSTTRTHALPSSERVLYNSHLHLLKTRAGTRQWKAVWAVLRSTSLALYKNEEEYQPLHVIPFSSIVEATDVEDLGRSKKHCFQVITEEKQLKFCARSEEEVARWVGGVKAVLAKRRESGRGRDDGAGLSSSPTTGR